MWFMNTSQFNLCEPPVVLKYLCAECVPCKFGEYDEAANREMGDLMECLIMSIYPD